MVSTNVSVGGALLNVRKAFKKAVFRMGTLIDQLPGPIWSKGG